jgi:hypothetical protein
VAWKQDLAKVYARDLHSQFKTLYANWLPDTPLKLGDFGPVNDYKIFQISGNITDRDYGIEFQTRGSRRETDYEYTSAHGVNVTSKAKGSSGPSGVNLKAGLEITFSRKNAIFFHAAKCSINLIANKVGVGKAIRQLIKQDMWDTKHAVVTEIVEGGATTIITSRERNASISLEAESETIQQINLAKVSGGLDIKASSKVGFSEVTTQGLQPLMELWAIQGKNLDFRPLP